MKMRLFSALSLVLVLSWVTADVLSLSLHAHPQHQSRHYRRLQATQIENNMDPVRMRSISPPGERKRSLFSPRSDTSCDSTVPQPLLIGVVLGIFGTLFIQGFVLVLFRMYHKNQGLRNKATDLYHPQYHLHHSYPHGQVPLPSTPSDFRHLEHIATSHSNSSAMSSTAGLLRIAHRRPDGSWTFSEADSRSDARSEISSISPFATPLHTPSSHRFPPLRVPSVPHSVSIAPRMSMETITSVPGGYEKSVYSAHTYTQSHHTPVPSISPSAHSHSYSTPRTSSIYPAQSISVATTATSSSYNSKQQYHIQNLPPSSPPPPMPLPPLPSPGAASSTTVSSRSETQTHTQVEMDSETQTQAPSQSSRAIEEDVGSTKTGPPPYAAYIPTWREQQQMQTMPPLPSGSTELLLDKQRRV